MKIVEYYSFQLLMEEVTVAVQYRIPPILIILDNTYMEIEIDKINKYEPILDGGKEMAGQVVGGVPERD